MKVTLPPTNDSRNTKYAVSSPTRTSRWRERRSNAPCKGMFVMEITPAHVSAEFDKAQVSLDVAAAISAGPAGGLCCGSVLSVVFAVDTAKNGVVATGDMEWFEPLFGERETVDDYLRPQLRADHAAKGVTPVLWTCIDVGLDSLATKDTMQTLCWDKHSGLFSRTTQWFVCNVFDFSDSGASRLYCRASIQRSRLQ